MSSSPILHIRQKTRSPGQHEITLRLRLENQPDLEAEATIDFALSAAEQEDTRWYLEDYLQHANTVPAVQVEQIVAMMRQRGIELYNKVLDSNQNTRTIWFAIRNQLADLRIEIQAGIAEAAAIPWELMRDPQSDSALAVRVNSMVRVQLNPHISFVSVPPSTDGRIRLLYVCAVPMEAMMWNCALLPIAYCRDWAQTAPALTSSHYVHPLTNNFNVR
jgi:hypothetical protein